MAHRVDEAAHVDADVAKGLPVAAAPELPLLPRRGRDGRLVRRPGVDDLLVRGVQVALDLGVVVVVDLGDAVQPRARAKGVHHAARGVGGVEEVVREDAC